MRTAVLLLAACLLLTAAGAETMHTEKVNPSFDLAVSTGYDGMITYGKTIPVKVTVRNAGGDFEGTLGVNTYATSAEYDRYETAVSLPAGSEKEYTLPVTVYARQEVFTVELTRDGETVCAVNASPQGVFNPGAMLIGVLSTHPRNLNSLNITRENDTLARYELWQTVPLTAETFPEDPELLKSFGMLVIDDIDPAGLSRKQQDVLDNWLRSGRVLLVSGGAAAGRNTAYFNGYTGLETEGAGVSESVTAGLEDMISRAKGGGSPRIAIAYLDGADSLGCDAEGHGLVYRTPVGAGRIYTAAFELGDPQLSAESLMHFFWQQLLVNQDQTLYNSILYANTDGYSPAVVIPADGIPVKARSGLLPGLLIVAGALVLGCLLWAALKRKDMTRWMWLALPLISVAAAISLWLVSAGSETNRPVAVIARNLVQDSSGKARCYTGVTAAAPDFGRHMFSKKGEALRLQLYNEVNYFPDEEEEETKEPSRLRTSYTLGGESTLTAECTYPWSRTHLVSEGTAPMEGMVESALWMEEDGLHGEIVNHTNLRLKAGKVLTSFGFANVPALAPGEKAEVLMVKRTFSDPQNPVYEEGGIYLNAGINGLYTVAGAATGTGGTFETLADTFSSMMVNAGEQLQREKGQNTYGISEGGIYLYCAEPENLPEPEIGVDGKTVEQKTCVSLLNAEMEYVTVGRTGIMFRSPGMDVPERVNVDENLMPAEELYQGGNQYYHNLNESPTFRFTFGDMQNVRTDTLRIVTDIYYNNQAECYLLNTGTGAWDRISINEDVKNPGNYVDGRGRLFVQFRPVSQDMYADIPSPQVMLEGRKTDAEN